MNLVSSPLLNPVASGGTFTIGIPQWMLWGVGIAAAATPGMVLVASIIALAVTGITGGWQGGAEPWKEVRPIVKAFVLFGLPTGLTGSYLWIHADPWVSVLVGSTAFGIIWLFSSKLLKP